MGTKALQSFSFPVIFLLTKIQKTTDPVLGDTWELFSNYWQERETRLAEYKAKQAVPAPENPAPSSSTTSTVPPQPAPESAPAPAEPGKQ